MKHFVLQIVSRDLRGVGMKQLDKCDNETSRPPQGDTLHLPPFEDDDHLCFCNFPNPDNSGSSVLML